MVERRSLAGELSLSFARLLLWMSGDTTGIGCWTDALPGSVDRAGRDRVADVAFPCTIPRCLCRNFASSGRSEHKIIMTTRNAMRRNINTCMVDLMLPLLKAYHGVSLR